MGVLRNPAEGQPGTIGNVRQLNPETGGEAPVTQSGVGPVMCGRNAEPDRKCHSADRKCHSEPD